MRFYPLPADLGGDDDEGISVQITIGMQNTARELTLDVDSGADKVAKDLVRALETGAPLDLTDNRGRRVVVPAGALAYVEIGTDEVHRVGFDV